MPCTVLVYMAHILAVRRVLGTAMAIPHLPVSKPYYFTVKFCTHTLNTMSYWYTKLKLQWSSFKGHDKAFHVNTAATIARAEATATTLGPSS